MPLFPPPVVERARRRVTPDTPPEILGGVSSVIGRGVTFLSFLSCADTHCRRKIEMSPVAQSRDDILLAADATTQSTFRIPSVPRAGLLTPPFLGPFLRLA